MTADLPPVDFSRLAPPAGSRIVVTGGCGGIGRPLVAAGVAAGLEMAVLDLAESLERYPVPDGVVGVPMDARDDGSVASAFAELSEAWGGAAYGLVHLPGYMSPYAMLDDLPMDEIDEALNINLRSAFTASRAVLPMMRANGSGSLIFAASGLATLVEKGTATYSAAKAGLIALGKGLAKENAPAIRVNCIAPGAVETAFLRGGTGRGGDTPSADAPDLLKDLDQSGVRASIPMGRIAVPDDVVGPILFLLSEKARFMTGQTLYINGGRLMV